MKTAVRCLFKGTAMQRRVETDALAGRRLVSIPPGIQQGVRLRKEEAPVGHLRPFAVEQSRAHIADMAETNPGSLGKFGDAPGAARIAQHHAQYLRGFGFEERLDLASFDRRLARYEPVDEYAVENDPGI